MPKIPGKPYPGGNFMSEISGRLLHGGQNLARDSVCIFARWEFYAQNSSQTFAWGAKPSLRFGSYFCTVGYDMPKILAYFTPGGNDANWIQG